MEKRRIGSLEVSVVGLGCNNFGGRIDEQRTAAVVGAALDAGIARRRRSRCTRTPPPWASG
ncbi:hypothetical protein WMF45_13010 [Sorangium sp. So ce448]